jgi:hypothetical protein
VPATDVDWVLAVDVRTAERRTAAADADGVRIGDGRDATTEGGRPPLAVVVVHPATWSPDRVAEALADVAGAAPA